MTRWTWVWTSCGSWWWIGRPGMLQSIGVRHDWMTELTWTELNWETVERGACMLQFSRSWRVDHSLPTEQQQYRFISFTKLCKFLAIISSVQSFSYISFFVILWTAAHQASLSITNSQSLHLFIVIISSSTFKYISSSSLFLQVHFNHGSLSPFLLETLLTQVSEVSCLSFIS